MYGELDILSWVLFVTYGGLLGFAMYLMVITTTWYYQSLAEHP